MVIQEKVARALLLTAFLAASVHSSSGYGSSGAYAGAGAGAGAYTGGPGGFAGGIPNYNDFVHDYQLAFNQFSEQAAHAMQAAANGYGGGGGGAGGNSAYASGYLGPSGGAGSANVNPSSPDGLDARFGQDTGDQPVNSFSGSFPAPSGTGYRGTFSSASSGQSSVNGKTTGYKTATVGVNDNGRITSYTSHNPHGLDGGNIGFASGILGPSGSAGIPNFHLALAEGLGLRFGQVNGEGLVNNFSPPSGSGISGIFSSISSGQSSANGKNTGYNTVTIGVNDNGRITTYTSNNPQGGAGGNSAFASGYLGPLGDAGTASVNPPSPVGLDVRFGQDSGNGPINSYSGNFPAPSGFGFGGSFSSVSSSSQTSVDGKTTGHNTVSVGVNDNGRITSFTSNNPIGGGTGGNSALASGYVGPSGDVGTASVNPPSPVGLDVRFGQDSGNGPVNSYSGNFPAPSGSGFGGSFSSASSSSQTSVDGKTTGHNTVSVGVNDNGRITSFTSNNPIGGGGTGGSSALASGYLGPSGGAGTASVNPPSPDGLDVKFGQNSGNGPVSSYSGNFPAPSGSGFGGSFSSASSSSQTSVDGKTTGHNAVSAGVNDNGRITGFTSHNPIGGGGAGGNSAFASGYLGPSGGVGTASVNPPSPDGLDVKFGQDTGNGPVNSHSGNFPAPSGPGFSGTFSSASSGQTSVDGKTTGYNTATVGVNDNGNITSYTSHNP